MKPTADPLFSYIEFHARLNPYAHAVHYTGGVVTYGQMVRQVEWVTARLAAFGLPKGSVVAMLVHTPYLHWLLIFAAQRLGLVTAALGETGAEVRALNPQAVVTDMPEKFGGVKVITVSMEWLNSVSLDGQPLAVTCAHDDPARIVMSSGTTGTPKKALFTFAQLRARVDATVRVYQLTSQSRFIATIGITTVGGLVLPIAAWAAGGTVLMPRLKATDPLWKSFELEPNSMFMSTAQLDGLMRTLPHGYVPPRSLRIFVAGSILPPKVSRAVRMRLTHELINVYGSTEAGTVTIANAALTDARPNLTGFVVPAAEVQIVDEAGTPQPNGTPGDVRLRMIGQCSGYIDDPKTTAECFRDGWVHPGDLGILGDDGSLSIVGRTRELMNFSGAKLAPHAVEEAVAGVQGVIELAMFAFTGKDGLQRPCAAVVAGEDFDEAQLNQRFRQHYPRLPELAVARVSSIPRNDMGKVARAELANSLAAQLGAKT